MDEDHVTLLMELPAEAVAAETQAGFVASAPTPIPPTRTILKPISSTRSASPSQ